MIADTGTGGRRCPTVTLMPTDASGNAGLDLPIEVGLNAVIVAVTDETPRILTIRPELADRSKAPRR